MWSATRKLMPGTTGSPPTCWRSTVWHIPSASGESMRRSPERSSGMTTIRKDEARCLLISRGKNESLSKSIYSVDARLLSDTHGRDFAYYGNGASEFDRHQFGYHHQEVQEESKEG